MSIKTTLEASEKDNNFYDNWREFWSKESQYTEQTHLTADTIGIIKEFVEAQKHQSQLNLLQAVKESVAELKKKNDPYDSRGDGVGLAYNQACEDILSELNEVMK